MASRPDRELAARRLRTPDGNCDLRKAEPEHVADLPYPDQTFDLIVSSMSQHHWADPHAGLRELRRVLRPAGRIWIYDFRIALRRAATAASAAYPAPAIRRANIRTGRLPISLFDRLIVEPAG